MELPRVAAQSSNFVHDFLCSLNDEEEIPVLEIPRSTTLGLQNIVNYLVHHHQVEAMIPIADPSSSPLPSSWEAAVPQAWYRSYVESMGVPVVWKVRALANYMGIEQLSLLLNVWLTFQIAKSSLGEIGQLLHIPALTESQRQAAQEREPWLFEDPSILGNETGVDESP